MHFKKIHSNFTESFNLYQVLRNIAKPEHGFFLHTDSFDILSLSPELFLQVINGEIKRPTALYTDSRQKVKFGRLLKLKKSFLSKVLDSAKDPVFKYTPIGNAKQHIKI